MVLASKDFVSPLDLISTTTVFFGGEIFLDPASSKHANQVVQATRYFDWKNNGLKQDWKAKNIYLYPPRDVAHIRVINLSRLSYLRNLSTLKNQTKEYGLSLPTQNG